MRLQIQSNPPTQSTSPFYATSKIVMPCRHTGHNGLLLLGNPGVWERKEGGGGDEGGSQLHHVDGMEGDRGGLDQEWGEGSAKMTRHKKDHCWPSFELFPRKSRETRPQKVRVGRMPKAKASALAPTPPTALPALLMKSRYMGTVKLSFTLKL